MEQSTPKEALLSDEITEAMDRVQKTSKISLRALENHKEANEHLEELLDSKAWKELRENNVIEAVSRLNKEEALPINKIR